MARNPPHPHPSEFRRLLASNEVPTASEKRTPRAPPVLDSEDYRAHMAPLTIQMDNQPSLLHEITEQRQGVDDASRGMNTALVPVRRLPAEVLGEIFLWTLKSCYPRSRTGTRAPWYLGQVCRSWRNIALCLPHLWSKIRIDEHNSESVQGRREIEEQLARSATTPLSVFIMWPSHTPEKLAESAQLVELVVAHCERWRHLAIEAMANIGELLPVLAPAKGHLPQLEKLRFQLYWDAPYQSDMFMDAPKLFYVKIAQQRLDCFPVPWNQIRRASIASDLCMPDPLPLTWASGLATLILYIDIQQNEIQTAGLGLATLPRLRHFGGTVQGLACFVVPALQTLRLRLASNWELDIVRDFLARSQCPLRALDIRLTKNKDPTEALDMATLADILRCVPSLELLILTPFLGRGPKDKHEPDSDDPIFPMETLFSVMRLNKSTDDVLPNLSTFVFGIPYNPSETDLVSEMVRSRASTQMYLPKAWKSRLEGRCGDNVQWIDIDPEMFLHCERLE
uniref:F-box domain-containing protein n=1 Tax=Mycena chlorophos TaxID=658473 RepID=A0ABQ0LRC7_MYCCL|nr:predicted protein [Mycena chlorophos]